MGQNQDRFKSMIQNVLKSDLKIIRGLSNFANIGPNKTSMAPIWQKLTNLWGFLASVVSLFEISEPVAFIYVGQILSTFGIGDNNK